MAASCLSRSGFTDDLVYKERCFVDTEQWKVVR